MITMLIDPNAEQAAETKSYLKESGDKIIVFCDPMEAVKYGYNHEVDVVYTEVDMPRMSGFDMIRLLRKRYTDIKVYFVTGSGTRYLKLAKQAELTGYYIKPLQGDWIGENLLLKLSVKKIN